MRSLLHLIHLYIRNICLVGHSSYPGSVHSNHVNYTALSGIGQLGIQIGVYYMIL